MSKFLVELRKNPCTACQRPGPCDIDHLITRAAGGKDTPENCWPLCRANHVERHAKGITHMADKYPSCKRWLLAHGWAFDDYRKRWSRK